MSTRTIITSNPARGVWPFTQASVIYEPIAIAILASVAFALCMIFDEPWMAVALVAVVTTAAVSPTASEASFQNVMIGNLVAMFVAFVTIDALGLQHVTLAAGYSSTRAIAMLIVLMATPMICTVFRVVQPAAAATAAFIIFGGIMPTAHSALVLTVEIVVIAALGDVMRRMRVKAAPKL